LISLENIGLTLQDFLDFDALEDELLAVPISVAWVRSFSNLGGRAHRLR
jgi:hypothetical protein